VLVAGPVEDLVVFGQDPVVAIAVAGVLVVLQLHESIPPIHEE
jgi:hypothetical protein